jgi:dipeptidase
MPDDERFFSVCMHAGPVGVTAASMIVELGAAPGGAPRPAWVSFCNPCVSPYLPVFPEAPIPAQYATGGPTAEDGSAWWRFKRLLTALEQDFPRHARRVRDTWRHHEREIEARTHGIVEQATAKTAPERTAMLEAFMREVWMETESVLDSLIADVEV